MARLETELLSTIGYITQDTRGKSCVDLRVYKWKISVVERSEGGVEEWLYHETAVIVVHSTVLMPCLLLLDQQRLNNC